MDCVEYYSYLSYMDIEYVIPICRSFRKRNRLETTDISRSPISKRNTTNSISLPRTPIQFPPVPTSPPGSLPHQPAVKSYLNFMSPMSLLPPVPPSPRNWSNSTTNIPPLGPLTPLPPIPPLSPISSPRSPPPGPLPPLSPISSPWSLTNNDFTIREDSYLQGSGSGTFEKLLWTHNTPYETIYKMMTGEYDREIRCCTPNGEPFERGAQFRWGLDSQYGDILFVMEPGDWWKNLKGVEMNPYGGPAQIVDSPVIGHFFKDDFTQYKGEGRDEIEKMMLEDAHMYGHRPHTARGSGAECNQNEWDLSWCNLQLHSGTTIPLTKVEKVLFPRWMITDNDSIKSMTNGFEFINMVSNILPTFPDGSPNPLNGKFVPYGPEKKVDAYQYIRNEDFDKEWNQEWYGDLDITKYSTYGNTARDPSVHGNSSRLAVSTEAFEDAEKIYFELLFRSTNQ